MKKQKQQQQQQQQPSKGNGSRAGARTLLMVSLTRFYGQPANLARALPYLTGESPMSLRLIDWFVTNYAKTHNVVLMQAAAASSSLGSWAGLAAARSSARRSSA
jgi:uncharacterized protein (DUF2235 family)